MQKLPPKSWLLFRFAKIMDRCILFGQTVANIQNNGVALGGAFNIYNKTLRLTNIKPIGLQWEFAEALGILRGRVGETLRDILDSSNTQIPAYLNPLIIEDLSPETHEYYKSLAIDAAEEALRG